LSDVLFTAVDELIRRDHCRLTASDKCFFLREYTSEKGYDYSKTNSLILNLKKDPKFRGKSPWKFKESAIQQCAEELKVALSNSEAAVRSGTLVSMPPSKRKGDPEHDDRMLRVLQAFSTGRSLDIRELVLQKTSTAAVHRGASRDPDKLAKNFIVDENVASPTPKLIILFDDVLTTGAHFVAAKRVLNTRFPGVAVNGVFLARRVFAGDQPGQ